MDRDKPLLTIKEVAEMLNLTPRAVRARVQRDALPGVVRLSERTIRFRRAELVPWLKEQEEDFREDDF